MKKICIAISVLLGATFLAAAPVEIIVVDRELEIPLEGANIQTSISSIDYPAGIIISGETDSQGIAFLDLPEVYSRCIIAIQFPGYEPSRVLLKSGEKKISVAMNISGVIEGKELVVERNAPGKTDAKSGVSVVMDKKDMETTANMGLVEDVMNSIKTLPGISYAGGWNALPSIRGGYPEQMGTVLDGVYIISPFHWGGAFSIFNPNMVESVKMSHGVFSARYGRAMSGLLEVSTIEPEAGEFRFDFINSTSSVEAFVQIPLGKKAGIFTGGKITYMETISFLNDTILRNEPKLGETIPTMPYIRDAYAKFWFNPDPTLSLAVNGFLGSDGIGVHFDEETEGIRNVASFDWGYLIGFGAAHLRWMPGNKTVIKALTAYNNNTGDMKISNSFSGSRKYSDSFLEKFDIAFPGDIINDGKIVDQSEYSMDGLDVNIDATQIMHQVQGRVDADILLSPSHIFSFGVEEVFQFYTAEQTVSDVMIIGDFPNQHFMPFDASLNIKGNKVLNSSAYALWYFGEDGSKLKGELGLRGDHFYLWNSEFDLNSMPVLNPRLNVEWTVLRNTAVFDSFSLSAGTGFFSMLDFNALSADEKFNFENITISPGRSWFQLIGAQAELKNAVTLRVEAYYKNYFNRLYFTNVFSQDENTGIEQLSYDIHTDGKGFSAGFDLMLQKKSSRRFDGYMSWSWVVTKYMNPTRQKKDGEVTSFGEPLDEWFYPSFHRFHSLNLIGNWRPISGLTFTVKASLATGTPRAKPEEIVATGIAHNGQIIERYTRDECYDAVSRNGIACPVDIRLSYAGYNTGSKFRWEWYIGVEDIFVNLYRAKGNTSFDPYTGKEIEKSDSADFNIGIPIPSIGYKISY